MKKTRAIFIGDVRFDQCPIFELNEETGYFEMLRDKEFRYSKDSVEEYSDFLVFEVENDEAKLAAKQNLLPNVES